MEGRDPDASRPGRRIYQTPPPSNRLGLTGLHRMIAAAALAARLLPVVLDEIVPAAETGARLLALAVGKALIGVPPGVGIAIPAP